MKQLKKYGTTITYSVLVAFILSGCATSQTALPLWDVTAKV